VSDPKIVIKERICRCGHGALGHNILGPTVKPPLGKCSKCKCSVFEGRAGRAPAPTPPASGSTLELTATLAASEQEIRDLRLMVCEMQQRLRDVVADLESYKAPEPGRNDGVKW
jgi:hypothetical protein